MTNQDDSPETRTVGQTRQGPKGKPVFYVLIASLILCAVFFFFVLGYEGDRAAVSTPSGPGAPVIPGTGTPAK